jgi:hypothetical protein
MTPRPESESSESDYNAECSTTTRGVCDGFGTNCTATEVVLVSFWRCSLRYCTSTTSTSGSRSGTSTSTVQ